MICRTTAKEKSRRTAALFPCLITYGGFEHIKAAVLYALIRSDALTLTGSAAYGGSRHETQSVSTKSDGV